MAEKIYVKGIRLFPKKDNQPEFVIGSGVITLADLTQFFKDNAAHVTPYEGKDQIRIQVLKGEKGPYVTLDTYKGGGQQQQAAPAMPVTEAPDTSGLPF